MGCDIDKDEFCKQWKKQGGTQRMMRLRARRIEELESCDPENDVTWFCNCLDTSINFAENEDIYRKYLDDEISDIEDNMGFEF